VAVKAARRCALVAGCGGPARDPIASWLIPG